METPPEVPEPAPAARPPKGTGGAPIWFAIAAAILGAIASLQCWEKVAVGAMVTAVGAAALWKGEESRRAWLYVVGGVLSVISLTVAGLIVIGCVLLGIGPIRDRDEWPSEVRRAMEVAGLDAANVEVAGIGRFIDRSFVWKLADVPREDVAHLIPEFELLPIGRREAPRDFRNLFPVCWRVDPDADAAFYATRDFPAEDRGSDGMHMMVMHDVVARTLYVWHKDNF